MLCPTCQRVSPAGDPAEYTAQRAALVVAHGLCLCQDSAPSATTASVDSAFPMEEAATTGPHRPREQDTDSVDVASDVQARPADDDRAGHPRSPTASAKASG